MLSSDYIKEYKFNNKSGKMSSEKYVSKNYFDDYNKIINYCEINNLIDYPFKEKVYHVINNIPYVVLCNNPNCKNPVKFKNSTIGYREYCCNKCVGSDPNIKNKKEETNIKKFGVKHASLNKDTKIIKDRRLFDKITSKLKLYPELELIDINYSNRNISVFCQRCEKGFSIHIEYFHIRQKENNVICTNCNPEKKHISGMEKSLIHFIESIYDGEMIISDRNILNGKEIDIYLPEVKIGFEFNGLYWHSELNKKKDYHIEKTKVCEEKNVNLLHIWEDDWILKRDIVKSIIRNRLNKTENKIFARKCNLREVNIKESKNFLDHNHIQGKCKSKIKIGLYYNDELISLMTFNKARKSSKNIVSDGDYELSRFCNILNSNVIGGFSRILKHFIKNYNPNSIISYSDRSIFDGKLYEKSGFKIDKISDINYKWVIGKKREHKSKFRKNRLVKMGYDPNKSEREIMYEDIGSFRVWDCGLIKWKYEKI